MCDEDIKNLFPKKNQNSHKGDFGCLLIIGGSMRYLGAVRLAYEGAAALRMGCGIVRIAIPSSIYPIVADKVVDATLFPLPEKKGYICLDEHIMNEALSNVSAVVCGVGIGNKDAVFPLIEWTMQNVKAPLLIDADGLNILSQNIEWLSQRVGKTILTPHIKEMSRLTGYDTDYIKNNKEEVAVEFAKKYSVTVILKDNVSIITDGKEAINNYTGTPAMAKGGSGDLLSGIAGGLLARGIEPLNAASAAAYIAGSAASEAVKQSNEYSLLPSDTAIHIEKWLTKLINEY